MALFRPLGEAAAVGGPAAAGRPEAIKAIPVRHWGRWVSAAVIIYLASALIYSFIRQPNVQFDVIWQWLFKPTVMHGMVNTIELTVIAMVIGGVGGTLLAVMRLSDNRVLTTVSWVYIWFFRGTPVLVQILIWGNLGVLYPKLYAGLPFTHLVFGSAQSSTVVTTFVAALLALGLNEAAYAAEIVRAGIISVEPGQSEAALSLGMPSGLTMRRIVLPQAMRVIIPPMGNETISMLKTTSLVVVISGTELLSNLQIAYSQNFLIMPLLLVACFWYVVLTTVLTIGQHYLEAYFGRGFGVKETEQAEKRAMRRLQRKGAGGVF